MADRIVSDQQLEHIDKRQDAGELLVDMAPEFGVTKGSLRTMLHRWRHRDDAPSATPQPKLRLTGEAAVALTSQSQLVRIVQDLQARIEDLEHTLARMKRTADPVTGNQYRGAPRQKQVLSVMDHENWITIHDIVAKVKKDTNEKLTNSMVRNVLHTLQGREIERFTRKERRGARTVSILYVRRIQHQ